LRGLGHEVAEGEGGVLVVQEDDGRARRLVDREDHEGQQRK
jgi:hypothetical protein